MKIDTSSDGFIDWVRTVNNSLEKTKNSIFENKTKISNFQDEFCSYMQLEYAEKEAIGRRALKVKFNIPAIKSVRL